MLQKKKHIINILLVVLAVIMTVSLVDIVPTKADQSNYKVVYTVKQLKKAMKAKAPGTIVFRTEIYGDITISSVKNAKNKDLILFAENANVKNKAKFSSISIRKISHYTEAVSGNNIYWEHNYYTNLTVAKGKTVNSLTYLNWDGFMPDYTLRKGAKIKSLIFKCFDKESTYDPENRTVSMSAYNLYADYVYPNKAVYTLDKSGRILKNEFSLSNDGANYIQTFKYDKNGNLVEVTGMEEGIETFTSVYEFDKNNNMIKSFSANTGGEGLSYVYNYDKNGNLVSYYKINSDGTKGNEVLYSYDKKGRCILYNYENIGSKTEYTYDTAGRLIEQKDTYEGITTVIKYEYDKNGLLIKETEEDDEGVYIKEYSVDHLGNRIFDVSKYIHAGSDDDKISESITFLNECLNDYRVYEDGFFSPVKANENDRDAAENLGLIIVSSEKELIEAISNEIISWESIQEKMKNDNGVTFANSDIAFGCGAYEIQSVDGRKWIAGSTLCLNLSKKNQIPAFYNPPLARGEDTFFSTLLGNVKTVRIPVYHFHDGFLKYTEIMEGKFPKTLRKISIREEKVKLRFLKATEGWIKYKPLLCYISDKKTYRKKIEQTSEKLNKTIPKLNSYFSDECFSRLITEMKKNDKEVEKHYAEYKRTNEIWKSLKDLIF